MAGVGTQILAADYNNIRDKIIEVMGTGAGTYGYGQVVASTAVVQERVTKAQWDYLRFDIVNARLHQTGSLPTIREIQTTDPIRYDADHPNYQYNTIAEQARTDRFSIGAGQFVTLTGGSATRSSSWSSNVSSTVVVDFGTVDQCRFFFNSGGKIRLYSARTGGSSTAQNAAWTSLLSAVGSRDFSVSSSGVSFYQLTNSYQTFYTSTSSSPYASNRFTIDVKCNVADNSGGTTNQLTFRITWLDSYTDPSPGNPPSPDDSVDGTLTLTIEEVKASGALLPSGSFTITSPTSYSISAIAGS